MFKIIIYRVNNYFILSNQKVLLRHGLLFLSAVIPPTVTLVLQKLTI